MALVEITRDVTLQRYYPSVVAAAREFKALAAAENPEFRLLWDAMWKWYANTFVYDTDEDGLERWEDMLGIIPPQGATIEERREAILEFLNIGLPYTERRFQAMLDSRYGEGTVTAEYDINDYVLWLNVSYAGVFSTESMRYYTRCIVPANLDIKVKNEKSVSGAFFVGGFVRHNDTIHIEGATDFTAPEIDSLAYFGGQASALPIHHIGGSL